MSAPVFVHVTSTGDIYVGNNLSDVAPGTTVGVYRVNPDAHFQKVGTITGTNPSVAVSGAGGKNGKEVW